ncbi:hypothetical protein CONLIGDRAFT_707928 [Coniochaeta ligniaria NRRL 30616]|uniref:Uncharacterized protein n=1 Tax=Coniochaeta ligniaria NRRL 30616 TaxID=1408157 RepID=A0A1J7JHH2_9PEZI|nr:hypothetical protein CONLIGDRAFT_707928 [Coniochaeta ligniaria NRRL 30616]
MCLWANIHSVSASDVTTTRKYTDHPGSRLPSHGQGCATIAKRKACEEGTMGGRTEETRRCGSCYMWKSRHGTERPEHAWVKVTNGCKNPNRKTQEGDGQFQHFGDKRRCSACYTWLKAHDGTERPREQCERWDAIRNSDAEGGCQNPVCGSPENVVKMINHGEHRRCENCHKYKRLNGVDRPLSLCIRDSWRNVPNDGCQNASCRRPEGGGEFTGKGSNRRCQNCHKSKRRTALERSLSLCMRDVWRNPPDDGYQNSSCRRPEGGVKLTGKGSDRRCSACYAYLRANGTDRSVVLCMKDSWRETE